MFSILKFLLKNTNSKEVVWCYNSSTKFSTSKIHKKDSTKQTTFYIKVTMESKLHWSWGFVYTYWKAALPKISES